MSPVWRRVGHMEEQGTGIPKGMVSEGVEVKQLRRGREEAWAAQTVTDIPSSMTQKYVGGAPASLKSSVVILLCRPDLRVGTVVSELGNLKVVEVIGLSRAETKWWHSTAKGGRSCDQNSLTHADLWCWLVEHSIPRREKGSLPNPYLICTSRKALGQVNRSLNWIRETDSWPLNQSPDLSSGPLE